MEKFTKIIFQIILFTSLINLIKSGYGVMINDTEVSKCLLTEPIKDIKDDCYEESIDREKCCYVEIKFKYNTYVSCIPVDFEQYNIRDIISYLKETYKVDSNSIKIDCNNSFIKLSLIFAILIFII